MELAHKRVDGIPPTSRFTSLRGEQTHKQTEGFPFMVASHSARQEVRQHEGTSECRVGLQGMYKRGKGGSGPM